MEPESPVACEQCGVEQATFRVRHAGHEAAMCSQACSRRMHATLCALVGPKRDSEGEPKQTEEEEEEPAPPPRTSSLDFLNSEAQLHIAEFLPALDLLMRGQVAFGFHSSILGVGSLWRRIYLEGLLPHVLRGMAPRELVCASWRAQCMAYLGYFTWVVLRRSDRTVRTVVSLHPPQLGTFIARYGNFAGAPRVTCLQPQRFFRGRSGVGLVVAEDLGKWHAYELSEYADETRASSLHLLDSRVKPRSDRHQLLAELGVRAAPEGGLYAACLDAARSRDLGTTYPELEVLAGGSPRDDLEDTYTIFNGSSSGDLRKTHLGYARISKAGKAVSLSLSLSLLGRHAVLRIERASVFALDPEVDPSEPARMVSLRFVSATTVAPRPRAEVDRLFSRVEFRVVALSEARAVRVVRDVLGYLGKIRGLADRSEDWMRRARRAIAYLWHEALHDEAPGAVVELARSGWNLAEDDVPGAGARASNVLVVCLGFALYLGKTASWTPLSALCGVRSEGGDEDAARRARSAAVQLELAYDTEDMIAALRHRPRELFEGPAEALLRGYAAALRERGLEDLASELLDVEPYLLDVADRDEYRSYPCTLGMLMVAPLEDDDGHHEETGASFLPLPLYHGLLHDRGDYDSGLFDVPFNKPDEKYDALDRAEYALTQAMAGQRVFRVVEGGPELVAEKIQ
jgi:hypothetical protein